MKAWDYRAVIYHADYYCNGCLPATVAVENIEIIPIFATDEMDYYPVCCQCGTEHDYMGLTEYGSANTFGIKEAS